MTTTSAMHTILVVDDNPNNLGVLSDFLWDMGFEVLVARDGESALQKVEYETPALILLDVMMPGIDGFETCRRLKAQPGLREVPIIFMTALSDTSDKVKGLSLGAVDYITKPFQQDEVLARVKLHLKLYTLAQTLAKQNLQLQQEVELRKSAEADLQSLNQNLESQVATRTQELSKALEDLKQIQLQLVQSEKMSSLGQLVAGVAHEINNPVNFIYGNLKPAADYIQDLMDLVSLFQQEYPELTHALQERIEEIDLAFLQQDLTKLLSSMQIGTKRIREIVLSLRNFSRLDEAQFKLVDIHAGLDSTLLILGKQFQANADYPAIELVKDYGQLPQIECYASQLNQVFMNIISNAIDALKDGLIQGKVTHPQIQINTEILDGSHVRIRIADNGPGIASEDQAKLFDAFFTTKSIGKGTGLGLSISYQIIVEKHKGKLECHSSPGKGAEFLIEVPICHDKDEA